jgi:hypothetical protein
MAKAAILSDPSFREAWEVHRWGFLDSPLIISRRYPVGLVLENLAETGCEVSDPLDALVADYCQAGYRYLDPAPNRAEHALPPDSDTLGVMLRLIRHSKQREAHLRRLEQPLEWLGRASPVNGTLPMYLLEGVDRAEWTKHFSGMIGMACDGVTAGALLGLARTLPDVPLTCAELLRRESLALGARVERFGVGGCSCYRVEYLCYILSTLAVEMRPPAGEQLCAIAGSLIERTKRRVRLSPQEAALLTLACLALAQPAEAGWLAVILGGQRYDGTWEPEPLYLTPFTDGMQVWYSSRLVTTSFCYRALCIWRDRHGDRR